MEWIIAADHVDRRRVVAPSGQLDGQGFQAMRRLSYQKAVDALLSNVKRRDDRRYRNFIRAARSFSCGFNGVQHIRVGRVF
jgi:hypothetical protein